MTGGVQAQTLPLTPLPDDSKRAFWWYHQVQDAASLSAFREVIAAQPEPLSVAQERPVRIAVLFPSNQVSDFWLRGQISLEARLKDLGIDYELDAYASAILDHLEQAALAETVLHQDYDYIIYGPTELDAQASSIEPLIADPNKQVIVWNYDTVLQRWGDNQPLAYVTFSHLDGAANVCRYVIDKLGTEGNFALMHGVPGSLDDQRSFGFRDCLVENSNWNYIYSHYGLAEADAAFNGGALIAQAYPEVSLIHGGNTAVGLGAARGVALAGASDRIHVTGWGGTGDELVSLKSGTLLATPMRMSDDLGVGTAEVIKYHLEGREHPLVVLGRITIAHQDMAAEEIDALEAESFRYSGVGTLER